MNAKDLEKENAIKAIRAIAPEFSSLYLDTLDMEHLYELELALIDERMEALRER